MNAILLLEKQLRATNAFLHEIADDLTDAEWTSRLAPNQNLISFAAWHVPRVQDHFVNVWLRNVTELCGREQPQQWNNLRGISASMGLALSVADDIARQLQRAEVLAYSDTVFAEVTDWLQTLTEADLEQIPNAAAHLAPFEEYQTPGYKADTDHLHGRQIWRLLSGPCVLHVYAHLGELEFQKAMLRHN